jgi:RNA polymerase sigma factor (sigma-70 family)
MIKGIPPLSPEEEIECLKRYKKNKDKAAYDKLVLSNQGFVYNIAKRSFKRLKQNMQHCNTIEIDDLINLGNIGLMRAIQSFDLKAHTRLLTFAGYWIQAVINLFINKELKSHGCEEHIEDNKDLPKKEDQTWDIHDTTSFIHNLSTDILLKQICKDLTDDEAVIFLNSIDHMALNLSKEQLAALMLKKTPKTISFTKKIKNKVKKSLKKCQKTE